MFQIPRHFQVFQTSGHSEYNVALDVLVVYSRSLDCLLNLSLNKTKLLHNRETHKIKQAINTMSKLSIKVPVYFAMPLAVSSVKPLLSFAYSRFTFMPSLTQRTHSEVI